MLFLIQIEMAVEHPDDDVAAQGGPSAMALEIASAFQRKMGLADPPRVTPARVKICWRCREEVVIPASFKWLACPKCGVVVGI